MKCIVKVYWNGMVKDGKGYFFIQSEVLNEMLYFFKICFMEEKGMNLEELIVVVYVGCFIMKLSVNLIEKGFEFIVIDMICIIIFSDGVIIFLELMVEVEVSGIDQFIFDDVVEDVEKNCLIFKLFNIYIIVDLKLKQCYFLIF